MLVLSRKVGEKIYVGNDIVLEIRRLAGNRVTVALDAPKSIRILRGELKEAATAFDEPVASDQESAIALGATLENVETFSPMQDASMQAMKTIRFVPT